MKKLIEISELKDFFCTNPPKVSFEFFPPKTPEAEQTLWHTIVRLEPLRPEFVGVTYGAGGSTRERTHNIVTRIAKETSLVPASHLTCAGASRAEIDEIARRYWEAGIRHIVALRGDPPKGSSVYEPHPQGYRYCCDLVAGLRKIGDFEISVAAFPEGHPESKSLDFDMEVLKERLMLELPELSLNISLMLMIISVFWIEPKSTILRFPLFPELCLLPMPKVFCNLVVLVALNYLVGLYNFLMV